MLKSIKLSGFEMCLCSHRTFRWVLAVRLSAWVFKKIQYSLCTREIIDFTGEGTRGESEDRQHLLKHHLLCLALTRAWPKLCSDSCTQTLTSTCHVELNLLFWQQETRCRHGQVCGVCVCVNTRAVLRQTQGFSQRNPISRSLHITKNWENVLK